MKKLLVLAALSAMAFGAKAEYYTFDLPGAKAAYFGGSAKPDRDFFVKQANNVQTYLDENAMSVYGSTWAERWEMAEYVFGLQGLKAEGADGHFSIEESIIRGEIGDYVAFQVLTDSEKYASGATLAYYIGQLGDGVITMEQTPLASVVLPTDAAPVPEPTSGLLLLLGIAGLALKRKRA